MKIVTLDSGPEYTGDLAQALLERRDMPDVAEWCLADADPERLAEAGRRVQDLADRRGRPFRVHGAPHRREALQGADLVLVRVQAGGSDALDADALLCRRRRLIYQESTGVGGMAAALRTVPGVVAVAEEMRAHCPEAWLIHTANPAGLVVEALQQQVPDIRSLGLSGGPVGYQSLVAGELGRKDPFEVELDYLGLNQLAWVRGGRAGGVDVWKKKDGEGTSGRADPVVVRLGLLWDYYLSAGGAGAEAAQAASGDPTTPGGEGEAREDVPPSRYLKLAPRRLSPERPKEAERLEARAAAHLIEAVAGDLGREQIVSTRHLGAAEGLPGEWVLELPCRVFRDRVEPRPAPPLPVYAEGLLRVIKSFELLVVEAACTGSRSAALAALAAHPLGPDVEQAEEVLEEMLSAHREYLPRFF